MNCNSCKFCGEIPHPTDDWFEVAFDCVCHKQQQRIIQEYLNVGDKIDKTPDWCPLCVQTSKVEKLPTEYKIGSLVKIVKNHENLNDIGKYGIITEMVLPSQSLFEIKGLNRSLVKEKWYNIDEIELIYTPEYLTHIKQDETK